MLQPATPTRSTCQPHSTCPFTQSLILKSQNPGDMSSNPDHATEADDPIIDPAVFRQFFDYDGGNDFTAETLDRNDFASPTLHRRPSQLVPGYNWFNIADAEIPRTPPQASPTSPPNNNAEDDKSPSPRAHLSAHKRSPLNEMPSQDDLFDLPAADLFIPIALSVHTPVHPLESTSNAITPLTPVKHFALSDIYTLDQANCVLSKHFAHELRALRFGGAAKLLCWRVRVPPLSDVQETEDNAAEGEATGKYWNVCTDELWEEWVWRVRGSAELREFEDGDTLTVKAVVQRVVSAEALQKDVLADKGGGDSKRRKLAMRDGPASKLDQYDAEHGHEDAAAESEREPLLELDDDRVETITIYKHEYDDLVRARDEASRAN